MSTGINTARKLAKKKTLAARDGNRCFYCNKNGLFTKLTLDHVIPKSAGGSNKNENLVLACNKCNGKKGSTPPIGFIGS